MVGGVFWQDDWESGRLCEAPANGLIWHYLSLHRDFLPMVFALACVI